MVEDMKVLDVASRNDPFQKNRVWGIGDHGSPELAGF